MVQWNMKKTKRYCKECGQLWHYALGGRGDSITSHRCIHCGGELKKDPPKSPGISLKSITKKIHRKVTSAIAVQVDELEAALARGASNAELVEIVRHGLLGCG